jgi:hypothetical protein
MAWTTGFLRRAESRQAYPPVIASLDLVKMRALGQRLAIIRRLTMRAELRPIELFFELMKGVVADLLRLAQ